MIKVYRFSKLGFKPQFQEYLLNDINQIRLINNGQYNLSSLNDHQIKIIQEQVKENPVDEEFSLFGVFAFCQKPSLRDYNYFLNHTDQNERACFKKDLHTLELPKESICYLDDGFAFRLKNKSFLSDLYENQHKTIYIPRSSLIDYL